MTNVKDLAYNGYPTRETYDISLWFNGEEYFYKYIVRMASESERLSELADKIESFFNDLEDNFPSFYQTIRYDVGSIWRVDWDSIAETFEEFIPHKD